MSTTDQQQHAASAIAAVNGNDDDHDTMEAVRTASGSDLGIDYLHRLAAGMRSARSGSDMHMGHSAHFWSPEEEEAAYDEEEEEEEDGQRGNNRLNSADFFGEEDAAERKAEAYENNRAGAWKRSAGPKKSGAKTQQHLEELRMISAALAAASSSPAGGGAGGGPSSAPYSIPDAASARFASSASSAASFDPDVVLKICDSYDAGLSRFLDSKKTSLLSARLPELSAQDEAQLVAVFDKMIELFYSDPKFKQLYHGGGDEDLRSLRAGSAVPSYFANVVSESMFRRKVLSMAGLRNLVLFGTKIFGELRRTLFVSNPNNNRGVDMMRELTGTVLDLDTVVLRCTDPMTLAAINMSRKHHGQREFASLGEFANSAEAREIAASCAKTACEGFCELFKLDEKTAKARNCHPGQISADKSPPLAQNNMDRGLAPWWRYTNAGQDSFHANVPGIEDVVGGLLKAPVHAARAFAFLWKVTPAGERDKMLASIYEDLISDSCLNGKHKAIEAFNAKIEHVGTIVDILQKLQAEHQNEFLEIFSMDNEAEAAAAEVAKMLELVQKNKCVGKSKASGKIRDITKDDVEKWVADPSVSL